MGRKGTRARRKITESGPAPKRPAPLARIGIVVAGVAVAALAIWMATRLAGRSESSRVNILLVTIDTLRWDHVGAYGDSRAATPVLDSLARRGAKFETAVAHVALTAPSHASMLTGLIPPRHGVRDNGAFALPANLQTLASRFAEAGYDTAAFVSGFPLDRRFGFSTGFAVYDDWLPRGPGAGSRAYVERRADDTTTRVLGWIDGRAQSNRDPGSVRPWFLWVHYFDPHAAYEPPPEFAARFPDRPYDGEIAFVDAQLGRLVQRLDQGGDLARTIVLVTADHGESLGEHGEQTHGTFVYDATLRVPLIVAGPGISAGTTLRVVARGVDVMPTLLDLAGIRIDAGLDGRSLRPALGGQSMPDASVYLEGLVAERHLGWAPLYGIRTLAFKYIDAPTRELYDLSADASEVTNRIDDHRDRAGALGAELGVALKSAAVTPAAAEATAGRNARPDSEAAARLRALGYLGGSSGQSKTAVKRDPKDGIQLINTLETGIALSSTDPARAVALLQSVLREDPRIELARRNLAIALVAQGRHREAIDVVNGLRSDGSATAEDLVLLGESLRVVGRAKEAEQALADAAALDPRSPEPALTLARSFMARNQPGEAAAAYRRALEIVPEHPEALAGLGEAALAQNDLAGASAWFERTLARDPQDLKAGFRLAVVRARQGQTADALPLFQWVVDREPAHGDALAGLAAALAKSGRPAEAIRYFERAIDAGARSTAVLNGLGLARLESGDAAGALTAFQASIKERPDQPEIARLVRDLSARRRP
ncbi:MAG: sulfatase-like hydrolase/transferase [Acidobacteriota bacterium]